MWRVASPALVVALSGCVYPVTTDKILVSEAARGLPDAERSLMYLSTEPGGYRDIDPDTADSSRGYLRLHTYYFPPGAIALTPGEHVFHAGWKSRDCRVVVKMLPGHAYRPVLRHCKDRLEPGKTPVPGAVSCWGAHADATCCQEFTETAPEGSRSSIFLPCEFD